MANTTTKPNTKSYGSYTQMFLDNDEKHFIDAMRTLPYNEVLSWGGRKHSEGMMPFMDEPEDFDYNTMDYIFPPPPTVIPSVWSGEDGGGGPGTGWGGDLSDQEGDESSGAYIFQCIIHCDRIVYGCDNYTPVNCRYGAVTGTGDLGKWSVKNNPLNGYIGFDQVDPDHVLMFPFTRWKNFLAEGDISFELEVVYADVGNPDDQWYYHPLMGTWIKILAGSSVCTTTVTFMCCEGLEAPVFDDDNTPDTIDGIDSITVKIIANSGPYTWSVSGNGYSLASAITSDEENVLTLDLGGGDCGTDFDPFCIVEVTDGCDRSCEFYILYSGGTWSGCNSVAIGGCTGTGYLYHYFIYSGQVFKQTYTCHISGSSMDCPSTTECNEIGIAAVPFYCPCSDLKICYRGLEYYKCA